MGGRVQRSSHGPAVTSVIWGDGERSGACGQQRGMDSTDAAIIVASIDEPVRFARIFDRYADAVRPFAIARVGARAADDVAASSC